MASHTHTGLAPVRSSKQEQIHASVVSTLLALMDGLDSRGHVRVTALTTLRARQTCGSQCSHYSCTCTLSLLTAAVLVSAGVVAASAAVLAVVSAALLAATTNASTITIHSIIAMHTLQSHSNSDCYSSVVKCSSLSVLQHSVDRSYSQITTRTVAAL
jgi:hypothetical protein